MGNSFLRYAALQGAAAIEFAGEAAHTEPTVYFNALLGVYRKYNALVISGFKNDPALRAAFQRGCAQFMGDNAVTKASKSTTKSAELLARYCNILLRKGTANLEESELEGQLSRMIVLLEFLQDKDVFHRVYHTQLARRLVEKMSVSEDLEEHAIKRFIESDKDCGFGHKERQMFNDIKLSKDFNQDSRFTRLGLNVQILSNGAWPFQQPIDCSLPPKLEQCVQSVTSFYTSQYQGRKLQWLHSLSKGELVTHCFKQKYVIQASTLQMTVLLQYNVATVWTVAQLAQTTGIQIECLLQVLEVLVKKKLLLSDEEQLELTSNLALNTKYNNRKLRLNINVPVKLERKREQEINQRQVEQSRCYAIQAAIVRIMKTRQQLEHQTLVVEVMSDKSFNFKPCLPSIKKSIDFLISKEYIERVEDQRNVYSYIS